MRLAKIIRGLLLAGPMLLSGCATKALWEEGRFARFHDPNEPPNLQLFYSEPRQDVLVQYVEVRDSDEALQTRAYWLQENTARIAEHRMPRFVSAQQVQHLLTIPVVGPPGLPAPGASCSQYAVASRRGAFSLYRTNQALGSYELPVYEDASGKVKQVLLTPFAVVADLSIVGGVIAYWALPGCWTSLNGVAGR